jgi:hypothetical protein
MQLGLQIDQIVPALMPRVLRGEPPRFSVQR